MKGYKFLAAIMITIFLSCTLLGCNGNVYQKSIYTNDKKIAKEGDSFSFLVRNGCTTKEEADIKFTSFDGDQTLWAIDAEKEGTVHLNFNSSLKSGKFKVVLITPDNEVISVFEEGKNSKDEFKIKKGKSRIKIVGSGAKGAINLSLKIDKNMSVEVIDD